MRAIASIALAVTAWACTHTTDPPSAGSGGAMASPFQAARERFGHDVAGAYGKRAKDLRITPQGEDYVGFPESIGELIGFVARDGDLQVRGLASSATVVLARGNDYGPLFRAARVLDQSAPSFGGAAARGQAPVVDAATAVPAEALAARVVWLMGMEYRLTPPNTYPRHPPPADFGPPALTRDGGSVALRFYYIKDDPIPGAPGTPFLAEIKYSPEGRAALVTTQLAP
jgi:hypothetical protein